MKTSHIIEEIKNLPVSRQMYIAEIIIKSIRSKEITNQMQTAANELYEEYEKNKELSVFTNIDLDNFYETAE